MGDLDKTSKNKRSTQTNSDKIVDKECKLVRPDSLHIYNTDTTHLIFSVIEKLDTPTLTKQVSSLLLRSGEIRTSASCITMMTTQY